MIGWCGCEEIAFPLLVDAAGRMPRLRQQRAERRALLNMMQANGLSGADGPAWVCTHVETQLPEQFSASELEAFLGSSVDYRCLMSRTVTGHVMIGDFLNFCETLKLLVNESIRGSGSESASGGEGRTDGDDEAEPATATAAAAAAPSTLDGDGYATCCCTVLPGTAECASA